MWLVEDNDMDFRFLMFIFFYIFVFLCFWDVLCGQLSEMRPPRFEHTLIVIFAL